MSKQVNLLMKEVQEGDTINGRKVSKSQAEKYNSFYKRTFAEGDIDDLLEQGGGESLNNFKVVSKELIKDQGYYDAMFPSKCPTFVGRDGKVRESKLSGRLGEIVFGMLPADQRVELRTIHGKKTDYQRGVVKSGKSLTFSGKKYRGGQFIPKSFFSL